MIVLTQTKGNAKTKSPGRGRRHKKGGRFIFSLCQKDYKRGEVGGIRNQDSRYGKTANKEKKEKKEGKKTKGKNWQDGKTKR